MSRKSDEEFKNKVQAELKSNPESNIVCIKPSDYGAEVITADKIIPKQQPWFWPGIIPLETSTLFAGFGGAGKSQLLIFLAAHTSNGLDFNGGGLSHRLLPGGVVILSGEDNYQTQLTPRLIAAKAKLSACHLVKMMVAPGRPKMLLDLDAHLILLEEIIIKQKESEDPIRLIIIDPVQYFTGEMKDHIGSNVCRFVGSLNDLAEKYSLAIIMNKHLRKKGGGDGVSSAVDAVSGSGAWTTAPRACWLIHRHPTKEGVVLFADLKNNLKAKDNQSMAYKINKTIVVDIDKKIETTSMEWQEEMEDFNADEALNTVSLPAVQQSARKWIIDFLLTCYQKHHGNGAMFSSSELGKEAMASGIKRTTYFDVRKKMIDSGEIKEICEGHTKKTIMIVLNDPELHR